MLIVRLLNLVSRCLMPAGSNQSTLYGTCPSKHRQH